MSKDNIFYTNKKRYLVEVGDIITIYHVKIRGQIHYETPLKKVSSYGKTSYFFKRVFFKNGVKIQNGARIKVLDFYETCIKGNDKYNPCWVLVIESFIPEEKGLQEKIKDGKKIQEQKKIQEKAEEEKEILEKLNELDDINFDELLL